MLQEMQTRNYSESTIRSYLVCIKRLSLYFNCSPGRLSIEQVKTYPYPLLVFPSRGDQQQLNKLKIENPLSCYLTKSKVMRRMVTRMPTNAIKNR